MIRMVDLPALHKPIQSELDLAADHVLGHQHFVGGPEVQVFEEAFAAWVGSRYCVTVNSGTAALLLGLMALDLPNGAKVATVANTFLATVEAIIWAGYDVAWVDIDPDTGLMDPSSLEEVLRREHVAAVLPVHLYGAAAPMPAIVEIAHRHGAQVVVDACQAHGTRVRTPAGLMPAVWGTRWAAYSFYPTKNLGALGDGGAILTDDKEIADRVRLLRHHGQRVRNESTRPGFTERLDTLQAAWLLAKLPHLATWNGRRRELAAIYDGILPAALRLRNDLHGESVFHLYTIRLPHRDVVRELLAAQGVQADVYYPHPAYSLLPGSRPRLPATQRLMDQVLSLPIHPALADDDVRRIALEVVEAAT